MSIRRPVSSSGLFLEHLIWTTCGAVGWNVYLRAARDAASIVAIDEWPSTCLFAYLELNLPLAVVLLFGVLLRRGCGAAISRAVKMPVVVNRWRLDVPPWLIVTMILGIGVASVIDVLFVWVEDLGRSSDWHWLLFPWIVVGAAVSVLSIVRSEFRSTPESSTSARVPVSAGTSDTLWDWFFDATIAALLSSLLLLVLVAKLFGELTHHELPDYLAATGGALLPLCCMLLRRFVGCRRPLLSGPWRAP